LGVVDPGGSSAAGRRLPLVRLAAAFYGVLFAVALVWALLAGRSLLFADAQAAARGVAPLRDLAAGVATGLAAIALSAELTRRTAWGDRLARALAGVLGRLRVSECVALALLSGVAEEAFFRGALQPQVGLLAASLLFALAHFAPGRDLWPWTLCSLAAGLALGGLFAWTGNLVAPVVAHALINAVNLRVLSVRYAPAGDG
jgi:membrane protease YdiL (CAAX protease family)